MNDLNFFTPAVIFLSMMIFVPYFYLRLFKITKIQHLTYSLYAAKDKIITALAKGQVNRNDKAVKIVYNLIIDTITIYKHLTLKNLILSSIIVKHSEEVEKKLSQEYETIKNSNRLVKEAYSEYLIGILKILYETSLLLRIALKCNHIFRHFRPSFSGRTPLSKQLRLYVDINEKASGLCPAH